MAVDRIWKYSSAAFQKANRRVYVVFSGCDNELLLRHFEFDTLGVCPNQFILAKGALGYGAAQFLFRDKWLYRDGFVGQIIGSFSEGNRGLVGRVEAVLQNIANLARKVRAIKMRRSIFPLVLKNDICDSYRLLDFRHEGVLAKARG